MSQQDLPTPGDILRMGGIAPKKSLGQHFLLDPSITEKVARCTNPTADHTVIEIGPGPGGLTRALIGTKAKSIIAVERDTRFVSALQPLIDAAKGRLSIHEADAVGLPLTTLCPPPRIIAANLPYNVGSVLLISWLETISEFDRMVLMFQKEVAQRITAKLGSKNYGRLAVMSQWVANVNYEFTVVAGSFTPPPKVDSAIVSLIPKPTIPTVPWAAMEKVVGAAFGQRRKMLRRALRSLGNAEALLEESGIQAENRAEDVSVEEFERLAAAYASSSVS